MVKCVACGKFLGTKEGVSCPKCRSRSHHECVRLPVGVVVDCNWRCGECQSKVPKGRDPSTPVSVRDTTYHDLSQAREERVVSLVVTDNSEAPPAPGRINIDIMREIREEMRSEFANMQKLMASEFKSSKESITAFIDEIRELKEELSVARSSFNKRMDAFDARLLALEKSRDNPPQSEETSSLAQALAEVKQQLNEREQECLFNDIVITGFPERKGENLAHTAYILGAKMGMSLNELDIVLAEREGPHRNRDDSSGPARARRIIVRFARRATRDQYLKSARVRRGLTTAELDVEGVPTTRIYVNERLTRLNGQLFAKAREECRQHSWKYCWSKDGRVFVRREHGTSYSRIRNEFDLVRIFAKSSV